MLVAVCMFDSVSGTAWCTAAKIRTTASNVVCITVAVQIMLHLGRRSLDGFSQQLVASVTFHAILPHYRLPCSEVGLLAPLVAGGIRIPMPPPRDLDFISSTLPLAKLIPGTIHLDVCITFWTFEPAVQLSLLQLRPHPRKRVKKVMSACCRSILLSSMFNEIL